METPADPLVPAVIEEMLDLADRLCRLGCILTSDAAVVKGHFNALQSLDLLTQTQRALADLLRCAGSVDERLAMLPLEAVAGRLRDRIAKAAA